MVQNASECLIVDLRVHGRGHGPGRNYRQACHHPLGPTGGEQHNVVTTANTDFGEPVGHPTCVVCQIAIRPGLGTFLLQRQYGLPVTVLSKHGDHRAQRALVANCLPVFRKHARALSRGALVFLRLPPRSREDPPVSVRVPEGQVERGRRRDVPDERHPDGYGEVLADHSPNSLPELRPEVHEHLLSVSGAA